MICLKVRTYPAPLMTTLAACHMHTTALLLDVDAALWTWLGVLQNPLESFQVFGSDFGPFGEHGAGNGIMSISSTVEAKPEAAGTAKRFEQLRWIKWLQSYGVLASLIGTPFYQTIVLQLSKQKERRRINIQRMAN